MTAPRRYRALDLFCCAGGASMGLHRAGFDVVGVDIRPQPNYPFEFHQADALTFPLDGFDFIWASPPCQAYSWAAKRWKEIERADLLDPIRQRLLTQPVPFVIENVVGAPLRADLVLMGQMFGLRVIKRRHFELHRFGAMQPARVKPGRIGFGPDDFVTVAGHGGDGSARLANWQDATGINWMNKKEMAEAIPPAYAEFIGRAAIAHLDSFGRAAA
jgi:DNA (cytosine-5)-methyltransferase 1